VSAPASVAVNPESSIYSAPTTTGQASNAAQSFYFGGNPTAALLGATAGNTVTSLLTNPWVLAAVALVAVAFVLRRGRL
jgi:hypothetical protein